MTACWSGGVLTPLSTRPGHASARRRVSLTLYIQKDSPGADKEPNWLPAPNDTIHLVMRLCWLKTEVPSILPVGEGSWKPPGIVKVQ